MCCCGVIDIVVLFLLLLLCCCIVKMVVLLRRRCPLCGVSTTSLVDNDGGVGRLPWGPSSFFNFFSPSIFIVRKRRLRHLSFIGLCASGVVYICGVVVFVRMVVVLLVVFYF